MDLVFDIGNTKIGVGLFDGPKLRAHWRIGSDTSRTGDEYGTLLRQLLAAEPGGIVPVASATVASVVPTVAAAITEACARAFGVGVWELDGASPLPLRLEVEQPLRVGADRIMNSLAAFRLFARDCMVVDLGTATTYDCVTESGAFLGGAIAPGARTAAECLAERTAKLPHVAFARPERAIGTRTETALQSGIFFGAVDAIDGMVHRIRDEWGRDDVLVVATGGLAPLLAPCCRTVHRIEPLLTLYGLRFARDCLADAAGSRPANSPGGKNGAEPRASGRTGLGT